MSQTNHKFTNKLEGKFTKYSEAAIKDWQFKVI